MSRSHKFPFFREIKRFAKRHVKSNNIKSRCDIWIRYEKHLTLVCTAHLSFPLNANKNRESRSQLPSSGYRTVAFPSFSVWVNGGTLKSTIKLYNMSNKRNEKYRPTVFSKMKMSRGRGGGRGIHRPTRFPSKVLSKNQRVKYWAHSPGSSESKLAGQTNRCLKPLSTPV